MTGFLRRTAKTLFGGQVEFRVRLFNILGVGGILASVVGGALGLFIGASPVNLALCIAAVVTAVALMWYSAATGRYQECYMITIIIVFLLIFPIMTINAGGYLSGMPSLFIFAIMFTVFMLNGKKRFVMATIELAVYTAVCIYAHNNPDKIVWLKTNDDVMLDIVVCFVTVSILLGVTMALHFNLYDKRQKELEDARRQVEELSKMKSELLVGISHEMRTPLTVMSAYAQFAVEQIRKKGMDEQALANLATLSDEAKRLAEMADGTLKILTNTLGPEDSDRTGADSPIDIGDLSTRLVRLLKPMISGKERELTAHVNGAIPEIIINANALMQMLWNILQNAIIHSDGDVELTVESDGGRGVKITVNDNGKGIDPAILPHIFKRGVSSKDGGTGIGLAICRDIARQYGGDITVQSTPGEGTRVTVVLDGIKKEAVNG